MNQAMYSNPFVECTARDMSFDEVIKYWCNPFSCYNLDEKLLLTSLTPILIQGSRGSGKTMILKYLSYYCQKENSKNVGSKDIVEYLSSIGSIGFYFRYKNDFGYLFDTINCSLDVKNKLFLSYFQLYISREIVLVFQDIQQTSAKKDEIVTVSNKIGNIFKIESHDFEQILTEINRRIASLDNLINNSRYFSDADDIINKEIVNLDYIEEILMAIRSCVSSFRDVKFIILIDEYENLLKYQVLVNTMLKKVDNNRNITYRLGMRPEGMSTYQTNIGNEFLQADRDYILKTLKSDNERMYKKFIRAVAQKRLESIDFFNNSGFTDIEKILSPKENQVLEAINITTKNPNKHFELIKKTAFGLEKFEESVKLLSYPDNPLIEMLNIVRTIRGINPKETNDAMNLYLNGASRNKSISLFQDPGYKYKLDYVDKYKSQLLFLLLGVYKVRKKYYSFNTFAYLSCGSVNDFISLCRNVFYCLDETFFNDLCPDKIIPMEVQSKGAELTSTEQIEKIRLCDENGTEMYTFLMNMGNLFQFYHKNLIGAKYPETTQFGFINEAQLMNELPSKRVMSSLIKWGVILKKSNRQRLSIHNMQRGNIYYLNRMFCPIFNISYRTRGGYNFLIDTGLFNEILYNSVDPPTMIKWKENSKKSAFEGKTVKRDQLTFIDQNVEYKQLTLFNEEDEND